ncbi:MAG: hypothetical protein ABIQ38_03850 [Ilumatobacteraceae bacterium]
MATDANGPVPWFRTVGIAVISFATLGVLAYSRAIFSTYGRLDDYVGVAHSKLGVLRDGVGHSWLQAGRVIPAVFGSLMFSFVDSVGELQFLRVVSTLMISMGGAGITVLALRISPRPWSRFTVVLAAVAGIVAISTTASPSAATWAIQAIPLGALPSALAAGIFATTDKSFFGIHWVVPASVFLLIAAFSYQHFVTVALLPVLMWTAARWASGQALNWRRVAAMMAMCITALGSNFLFVLVFGDGALDRISGYSLSERVHWFFGTYLPRTIDIFVPNTRTSVGLSVAVLTVFLAIPVIAGVRYLALSLAVLVSWVASALVVFPTELWASYRLIYPAQFVLWGGATVGVAVSLASTRFNNRWILRVATSGLVVVSLISLLVAGVRAYSYFAVPNRIDWASTRCAVANEIDWSVVVTNEPTDSQSAVFSYDEYGVIASNFDWVLQYTVWLAMEQTRSEGAFPYLSPGQVKVLSIQDLEGLPSGYGLRIMQDECGSLSD